MANKRGRPFGSISKPRLSDFITRKEVEKLVAKAVRLAAKGDTVMLKFVLEQHFGKAIQPVEGSFNGSLTLAFDKTFNVTSNTPPPPTASS